MISIAKDQFLGSLGHTVLIDFRAFQNGLNYLRLHATRFCFSYRRPPENLWTKSISWTQISDLERRIQQSTKSHNRCVCPVPDDSIRTEDFNISSPVLYLGTQLSIIRGKADEQKQTAEETVRLQEDCQALGTYEDNGWHQ